MIADILITLVGLYFAGVLVLALWACLSPPVYVPPLPPCDFEKRDEEMMASYFALLNERKDIR